MFCASCGASNPEAARFCERCGTAFASAQAPPAPSTIRGNTVARFAEGKNPVVAALLSFFIPFAIGQFYNGDTKKGLTMLAITLIAIPLWSAGGAGSLINFGVWVWSIIDAYRVASRQAPLW